MNPTIEQKKAAIAAASKPKSDMPELKSLKVTPAPVDPITAKLDGIIEQLTQLIALVSPVAEATASPTPATVAQPQ